MASGHWQVLDCLVLHTCERTTSFAHISGSLLFSLESVIRSGEPKEKSRKVKVDEEINGDKGDFRVKRRTFSLVVISSSSFIIFKFIFFLQEA